MEGLVLNPFIVLDAEVKFIPGMHFGCIPSGGGSTGTSSPMSFYRMVISDSE